MSNFIEPGTFYLYYGPMRSGKSAALIDHMDFLEYTDGITYSFFKPKTDTRDEVIKSRRSDKVYEPILIEANNPQDILRYVTDQKIVAIDEIQFFGEGIAPVVRELMLAGIQVIGSGLDTDFRGEVYGEMGRLLTLATHPKVLTAVCMFENCNNKAHRTQRLIDGKPAHISSPLDLIEGSNNSISYESRCHKHHEVPDE